MEKRAVIKVIGVGGGGGNAVNRMIEAGVTGVEFIAANTDAQVLELSKAPAKIQLGIERTGGLGCGGDPEVGRLAARDDMDRLIDVLAGADMIFITVGEGGGTGTGAAPVIACVAQEIKALCIAVATKPMSVEGKQRRTTANDGIRELREFVDTLICVPNDRVVEVYGNLKIRDAFRSADDVVRQAVQGISDLIQVPGEINLDFADVRSAMRLRGDAVMGIGQSSGEDRVEEATEAAISSPLLEDTSIQGATSIIVNVTGGESLTLNEVQRAVQVVRDAVAPEGTGIYGSADPEPGDNILIGTALDPRMDETGEIKVTVVATGFPDRNRANATPNDFANYTTRATGTFGGRGVAPSAAGSAEPSRNWTPFPRSPNPTRTGWKRRGTGRIRNAPTSSVPPRGR
ncbi:MAG: cell division protein FtsZ [Acidobacteria bacterium]|nr:cell division protein FtsZ [Acidobacteriota bacterium]